MRKLARWLAMSVGALALLCVLVFAWAWVRTEQGLARVYAIRDPALSLSGDARSLARGGHLFATRGCADCHGAGGAGRLVFDGGPVIRLVAPNITPGGVIKGLSADQIAAAIRHGVKPDGHPMVFMPTADFHGMSDADTAALVAYVQSLPASANQPGALSIRPLGRLLYALGKFPLLPAELVDHSPRARNAPPAAASVEYGRYIAQGCTGCHGRNLAGQHVPGTPPSFPNARNLTPAALGHWSAADFRRALREGKRPDGSALSPFMPWQALGKMSDQEIAALWAYLQTLPPVPVKKS
jgi:mono/diheme cytochrome c family protein